MAHNRFLLGLIWRIAPLRVCAQVLERCFSLSYGAFYTLIFFRYLINHLAEGAPFSRILSFLLLFTAIGLTDAAIKAWFHNLYQPRTDQLIRERLAVLLYNKAVNADLASREDPEAYDRYTRAAEQCSARCLRLLELLAGTAGLLLATALNAAFVLWADPSALALCIVPIALVFYFQRRRGVRAARLDRDGQLICQTEEGEEIKVRAGEVSVRGLNGYLEYKSKEIENGHQGKSTAQPLLWAVPDRRDGRRAPLRLHRQHRLSGDQRKPDCRHQHEQE